ncbi:hypothetical protein [Butyrivibrio sp. VCD2006]|uniref:hypothetical protein n=1 Tax=Butyrivibrio sp. VCD2006 TaxID=1280664 RepID=UPI0018CBE1F0|nr:hypothetical protein [Butyrivibrio sp. VCD2006]
MKNGADDVIMFALGETKEPFIQKFLVFIELVASFLRLIIWITEKVIVWLIYNFRKLPFYFVGIITLLYFITNIL